MVAFLLEQGVVASSRDAALVPGVCPEPTAVVTSDAGDPRTTSDRAATVGRLVRRPMVQVELIAEPDPVSIDDCDGRAERETIACTRVREVRRFEEFVLSETLDGILAEFENDALQKLLDALFAPIKKVIASFPCMNPNCDALRFDTDDLSVKKLRSSYRIVLQLPPTELGDDEVVVDDRIPYLFDVLYTGSLNVIYSCGKEPN